MDSPQLRLDREQVGRRAGVHYYSMLSADPRGGGILELPHTVTHGELARSHHGHRRLDLLAADCVRGKLVSRRFQTHPYPWHSSRA